jgi:hypothetical protein
MKDSPKKTCPKCGKATLERLIGTGAAVIFKGSGFYQTDYRSESYKKAADAETKPSSGGTEKPAETKSETTAPAAKAETPSNSNGTTPGAKEAAKVRIPVKSAAKKPTKKAGKSR